MSGSRIGIIVFALFAAAAAHAQEAENAGWKLDGGLSYLSTSGNSETTSMGLSTDYARVWPLWKLEAGASALRATDEGETVAENYLTYLRGSRATSNPRLSITAGWQGEQNEFAGVDFRSVADIGVNWKALEREDWTIETIASATWNYEEAVGVPSSESNLGMLIAAKSAYRISENASTIQIVRIEPNVEDADDYRIDARFAIESSLTSVFGIKLGYNYRYDNEPVPGFEKADTTTTVSLVLKIASGSLLE